MTAILVSTPGPDLRLDLESADGASVTLTAAPADYERIVDESLFGHDGSNHAVEPIEADRPVQLVLRWAGAGEPPSPLDGLSSSEWELVEATQERDGVRVGYTTRTPDRLADAVLDFLAADGWEAERIGDGVIRTRYAGSDRPLGCAVLVDEDREFIVALVDLPVDVPADRIEAVAAFAATVTFRTDIGAVGVNADGVIRFRHGVDVEGVALSRELVRNVIYPVVTQADTWLPSFRRVAAGADAQSVLDEA